MNNLKKIISISIFIIFAVMVIGLAYADEPQEASLLEWNIQCSSSDSAGQLDYIEDDNPNQAKDVGETTCEMTGGVLQCTINNAYPGYQVAVDASLDNTTSSPVTITGVQYSGKPDCVDVSVADKDGNTLVGQSIGARGTLGIVMNQEVNENAEQNTTYTYDIIITANQTQSSSEGGGDGGYDNPGDSDGGSEEVINPDEEKVAEPQINPDKQPEPELQIVPEETPFIQLVKGELPYTGGTALLFACAGLSLGGIAVIYRRRK